MSESSLFAAFGAVLGYIGAEAATMLSIERQLWPQRFYSSFTLSSLPILALFMPMGGPLHKAALKALDTIFLHGLFNGPNQGHMLGTAFFRQRNWTYTMHGDGEEHPSHTDVVRNCLWTRTLSYIPIPELDQKSCSDAAYGDGAEKGISSTARRAPPLRARTVVSHLTLSRPTTKDITSQELPFIGEGHGVPSLGVFLAICASETSAIITALAVFVVFRSAWLILWLLPLVLRLLSTFFALHREPLVSTSSSAVDDPPRDFEFHCPQSEGSFMVVTGPPTLVLQFVRHYGHPVRDRFREVFQLIVIMALASHFPLGLFCSFVWMDEKLQYVWLCYQLYLVLAMHIVRYSTLGRSTTTEAKLAQCLSRPRQSKAIDGDSTNADNESAVLFGHTRDGEGTVKARVAITYHNRYAEGKMAVEQLLHRRNGWQEDNISQADVLRGVSKTQTSL
ncbi:hypothetical protein NW767_015454 [Fusarium falciforme]|nr:hypothetical protein NW767_015454 [Fusarium falciforme]KAJ4234085.1 hypothetical protein NW757_013714 [Fusarium falciforme]